MLCKVSSIFVLTNCFNRCTIVSMSRESAQKDFMDLLSLASLVTDPKKITRFHQAISYIQNDKNKDQVYPEGPMSTFGVNVSRILQVMGLRQGEFAKMLNIDQTHLSKVCTGQARFGPTNLVKISVALDSSLHVLFSEEFLEKLNESVTLLLYTMSDG